MILDDFIAFNTNGLYCRYGDFYLDPQLPVDKAVISHAHADHAKSGNINVYATEATYAFMQLRYGKGAAKVSYTAAYNVPFHYRGRCADNLYPRGAYAGLCAGADGI
jgi:putative mRNA 3-end processing factor